MKHTLYGIYNKYKQFILYSIIGASGATLDFVAFLVLYNSLGVNPSVATAISISLGIINNFVLNVLFNFRTRTHIFKRFMSFYAVGLLGILVSIAMIFILHDCMGLDANIAKLLSIPVIVVIQYTLNKHITFGNVGAKLRKLIKF